MCDLIEKTQKVKTEIDLDNPPFELKLNTESGSEVTDTNLYEKGVLTEEKLTSLEP